MDSRDISERSRMQDTLHTASGLADHLPVLLLEAEQAAHSFMRGAHGRRRAGTGETFWQFRHYAPGDSIRNIDWKQTAKRDDAYVREREWEAAQTLWLWRDASKSMNFSSLRNTPSKRHCAEVLLLALGILALNGGEQVGLIGTGLAPQSHTSAIRRLCDYLPQQDRLLESGRGISARTRAVLFSDFYFPLDDISAFCARLAARHVRGVLVQLFDPAEKTLPYNGRVKFRDSEDKDSTLTLPQVESARALYEERFAEHQRTLARIAADNGWTFHAFSTTAPRENVLATLYDALAAS